MANSQRSLGLLLLLLCGCTPLWSLVVPEQRSLDIRDPSQLPAAPLPQIPPPETVSNPSPTDTASRQLSLDEAIRIALANSEVVRILAGATAVASGQTIYDPAISNTAIDDARSVFDPALFVNNNFNRTEKPEAILDPTNPTGTAIFGPRVDNYTLDLGLSKRNLLGGTTKLEYIDSVSRFHPGLFPLNPEERTALSLSYTQPLLRGAGVAANVAPIVIARINTERSYFQLKDSVQSLVRGVIEAYWNVVFAKTDVWAKTQQVEQGTFAYKLAEARARIGIKNAADEAQARVSLANFKANLIAAKANLLNREAALRNILGLRPNELERLELTTPPSQVRLEPRWEELLALAQERRPDLIELKLIIEADEQAIVIANNQALPQVDAAFFYRWNGLEGRTPSLATIETGPGQFTDWTLGVNFSVPLGLRKERAGLRKAELIVQRDRANLDQGLHSALFSLAESVRNLSQFWEQYQAFKETNTAARINLDVQLAQFKAGTGNYINVLLAIADWGNAVSAEAQSLTQYNAELANLERETGTILDTHGVRFWEERFRAIGPLGRLGPRRWYPMASPPSPNVERYPEGTEPAERTFGLESPALPK